MIENYYVDVYQPVIDFVQNHLKNDDYTLLKLKEDCQISQTTTIELQSLDYIKEPIVLSALTDNNHIVGNIHITLLKKAEAYRFDEFKTILLERLKDEQKKSYQIFLNEKKSTLEQLFLGQKIALNYAPHKLEQYIRSFLKYQVKYLNQQFSHYKIEHNLQIKFDHYAYEVIKNDTNFDYYEPLVNTLIMMSKCCTNNTFVKILQYIKTNDVEVKTQINRKKAVTLKTITNLMKEKKHNPLIENNYELIKEIIIQKISLTNDSTSDKKLFLLQK